MDVIATRDLEAGAEMTLNYGSRPMRDMLRGYGFTPVHAALSDPSEVYEEIGEACEALVVQGSGKVILNPACLFIKIRRAASVNVSKTLAQLCTGKSWPETDDGVF